MIYIVNYMINVGMGSFLKVFNNVKSNVGLNITFIIYFN